MKPEAFVILTPGFAKNEQDSACLPFQRSFAKTLKRQYPGMEVIVISFQYPFEAGVYEIDNCKVIALGGKERSGIQRRLLWWKAWQKLSGLSKTYRLKGLLSFWYTECALVGKQFGKKYGIPHRCWLMGQDARAGNRYVQRAPLPAGELIALSDFLQEEFERNYSVRPESVIATGVDTSLFASMPGIKDIDIMAAGSLIPLKQYEVFIRIIQDLKPHFPSVKTVLCGKGPEEEKLRAMISSYGLDAHITLTGELPHAETLKLMQRSRVLLHPSSYEGFSGVCAEALYAGMYVISFVRPMNRVIPNWHIAGDEGEMLHLTAAILASQQHIEPVLFCPIEKTVHDLVKIFRI